ncbi:beta-1,3-galactosyltransferase 9-like [Daphnia carinata]|uniref:beta-1,3-galactosyltransferase 9-like n=1 Tax=Daphnia carinata TaxID=120202 RepID=UPI00257F6766|nr:beta-1,3-galactosyltransferase 9-like [Daphnia carinata]
MPLLNTLMKWLLISIAMLAVFYLFSFRNLSSKKSNIWFLIDPANLLDKQKSKVADHPSNVVQEFSNVDAYVRYTTSFLALKPVVGSPALKPELGPVINDVRFQYSIKPSVYRCEKVNLFIIVISAPGNFVHRKLVRRTWGAHLNGSNHRQQPTSKFAFLIGLTNDTTVQNAIRNESIMHEDLIQVDLMDSYMNLTLKTVAMLHWSSHFCPNAKFILKCDDDVYLNVRHLTTLVSRLPLNSSTIYGSAVDNLKPTRPRDAISLVVDDDDKKWAISEELWPWSTYPTYVSGGCYLIDSGAIAELLAAVQTTPYFPFEDLYMTGLCARKANVQVLASDRMLGAVLDVVEDLLDENRWLMKNFVAWLTSSSDEMIASHLATEIYFNQRTGRNQNDLQMPHFNWSHILLEGSAEEEIIAV